MLIRLLFFWSDVERMHKEEIETENDDLKHHIRCYDCKFLRAQDTLRKLKRRLFWIQALSATFAISTNGENDWKSNWKERLLKTWLKNNLNMIIFLLYKCLVLQRSFAFKYSNPCFKKNLLAWRYFGKLLNNDQKYDNGKQ